MKNLSANQNLKAILLALILVSSVQYVSAATWSAPTGSPPANNTDEPINVSANPQTKLGGLIVASGVGTNPGLVVQGGKVGIGADFVAGVFPDPARKLDVNGWVRAAGFCIGSSCITSWPSGSPGVPIGVNSLAPAPGETKITVSPTSGNVTVSNTGNTGVAPQSKVKIFCIQNNPPSTAGLCPSGWSAAGVFDNGGSSWCTDLVTGNFKRWSSDAVLCFKSS